MDAVYSIIDQFLQQGNTQQAWNLLQSVADKTTPEYMQRVQQCQQMMAPPAQPQYQQPMGQPQPQQPQPQYQQPMGQPQYQQPQPQYQQPMGGPQPFQQGPFGQMYPPRPAINIWQSIASWNFKVMAFVAVGVFFLSIFITSLVADRTVNGLFGFFGMSAVFLAALIIYAKAAPKMEEGNGIGWALLVGGALVILFQFVLVFITSWDTYKTLNIIKLICMLGVAFPMIYAFFKVQLFEHSLPALLIGLGFALALLGGLVGTGSMGGNSFAVLCNNFAEYGFASSMIILLAEVIYNRSLNRG